MTVSPTATSQDMDIVKLTAQSVARNGRTFLQLLTQVRGPPQHGLSSDTMALITSDCGAISYSSIKWH